MRLILRSFACTLGILAPVFCIAQDSPGTSANTSPAIREIVWPKAGMGLDGSSYYASYAAFTNALQSGRWINAAEWDENFFPTASKADSKVTMRVGVDNGSTWPNGNYVLTWKGEGNVIVTKPNAGIIEEQLDGEIKRRVYAIKPEDYGIEIEISKFPATAIKLFLPGMEKHPSKWNPAYMAYLKPFAGGPIRFMDLNGTNGSKQKYWADRTPPNVSTFNSGHSNSADWPVKGRASIESMMELCNEMNSDMWFCVPHMASDEYIANLAKLIKTGIDEATGKKTTEPLKQNLRVWLEYSNEVWNWNFAQSTWVDKNVEGENLDVKYARRASHVFKEFNRSFEAPERVIRVIGTQKGYSNGKRSRDRLAALKRDEYDALALTTYFNGDFFQWYYDNPTPTIEAALDHIAKNNGTGPFGPNETGDEAENSYHHFVIAKEYNVPIISYEGNDHINPVAKVDTNGDGKKDKGLDKVRPEVVDFIHQMVRHPRMGEIYKTWLKRYEESGMKTNTPFVLLSGWSKYGQWGHVEYVGQPVEKATKYKALLDHYGFKYPDIGKKE